MSARRLLCQELPKPDRPTPLPDKEAEHAIQVLRLRDGDLVHAIDGKGGAVSALLRVQGGPPRLEFHAELRRADAPEVLPITLEIAVLKGEAMEWVVEKAVELGVARLVPLLTAHTVVQVGKKGPDTFQQRWQRIADQSLKQCERLSRLEVLPPVALETAALREKLETNETRYWCDEADRESSIFLADVLSRDSGSLRSARLLIGPEGGWNPLERERLARSGAIQVSLGPLVLRAETAALFGVSLLAGFFRANDSRT